MLRHSDKISLREFQENIAETKQKCQLYMHVTTYLVNGVSISEFSSPG